MFYNRKLCIIIYFLINIYIKYYDKNYIMNIHLELYSKWLIVIAIALYSIQFPY